MPLRIVRHTQNGHRDHRHTDAHAYKIETSHEDDKHQVHAFERPPSIRSRANPTLGRTRANSGTNRVELGQRGLEQTGTGPKPSSFDQSWPALG